MMQVKWRKNYNKPYLKALFMRETEYFFHIHTLFCLFDSQGSV